MEELMNIWITTPTSFTYCCNPIRDRFDDPRDSRVSFQRVYHANAIRM